MMQPVKTPSSRPAIASSCDSQTAYSSAVRVEWVAERHWAIHALPSCTAKRVLVLPCSMAKSMGSGPSEKDVAGRYALQRAVVQPESEGAVRVHALGDTQERAVGQARLAAFAQPVGAGRPALGDRRKPLCRPKLAPGFKPAGQHLDSVGWLGRRTGHVLGERGGRTLDIGGRVGQIDSDADG